MPTSKGSTNGTTEVVAAPYEASTFSNFTFCNRDTAGVNVNLTVEDADGTTVATVFDSLALKTGQTVVYPPHPDQAFDLETGERLVLSLDGAVSTTEGSWICKWS